MKKSKLIFGCLFAALFLLTFFGFHNKFSDNRANMVYVIEMLFCFLSLNCFLPRKVREEEAIGTREKFSFNTILSLVVVLLVMPFTIYAGMHFFEDRKYYLISVLIILEILLPSIFVFEKRKPRAREIIIISVLCAIAVIGRNAFFMLSQFKPALAIIIISAVCFGGETGFFVGAVYAFVSNFFFGQGPWTPWQMFAAGVVGFISGMILKSRNREVMSIFGFLITVVIYGGIMNIGSVLIYQPDPTIEMFYTGIVMGLPFDIIHGLSTAFFLWFIAEPMIEKLERLKEKYGIFIR